MTAPSSLVIADATLPDGQIRDVRINQESGQIEAVGRSLTGSTAISARGKRLLPGMIDVHVHFREPGFPEKETWRTGSIAAAAGGVTTVVDQPNTEPPTVSGDAYGQKLEFARQSIVDYGINGGVTPDWDPASLLTKPLVALGEVFLADSTGDMGITTALFADALERARRASVPVTVHAEDAEHFDRSALDRSDPDAWSAYRTPESEVVAIEAACDIARESGVPVHFAHTSTPDGIDVAREHGMTCEVTPHHLLLSRNDLDTLGTHGRMNPPLRSEHHRQALFDRVAAGDVDMIATDHAPHTLAEKASGIWEAPSGVPGVETALPLLLAEASAGRLSYPLIRDLTAANPAAVFGLHRKGRIEPGRDADLVLVDPTEETEITSETLHTKCGWTPFEGWRGVFPEWTMVRGRFVYRDNEIVSGAGKNVGIYSAD